MKKFLASCSIQVTKTDWKAAFVGGVGGFAGYIVASLTLGLFLSETGLQYKSVGQAVLNTSLLAMFSGAVLSCIILAFDNTQSLRGKWHRDVLRGLPLFMLFGLISGGLGQLVYSLIGLTRAGAWVLMGAGIGTGIGLLRRDKVQAKQGALGGAIGGLIGGVLVDVFLLFSYTEGALALASLLGIVIVGALIALVMRLVQSAFREAWLVGVSTGPYEGKEYPLNTNRVSVGRSELNNISLYRASELPMQSGALVFGNGAWRWQGEPLEINGQMQADTALHADDSLKFGGTIFRFKLRSAPQLANATRESLAAPLQSSAVASLLASGASLDVPLSTSQSVSWILADSNNMTKLLVPPIQLRLGRAMHNDIVVDDSSVSSEHVLIEAQNDFVKVTDLSSTNGTYINDRKLRRGVATLWREGDHLVIGQFQYSIRQQG
jgi:hypothetical protein